MGELLDAVIRAARIGAATPEPETARVSEPFMALIRAGHISIHEYQTLSKGLEKAVAAEGLPQPCRAVTAYMEAVVATFPGRVTKLWYSQSPGYDGGCPIDVVHYAIDGGATTAEEILKEEDGVHNFLDQNNSRMVGRVALARVEPDPEKMASGYYPVRWHWGAGLRVGWWDGQQWWRERSGLEGTWERIGDGKPYWEGTRIIGMGDLLDLSLSGPIVVDEHTVPGAGQSILGSDLSEPLDPLEVGYYRVLWSRRGRTGHTPIGYWDGHRWWAETYNSQSWVSLFCPPASVYGRMRHLSAPPRMDTPRAFEEAPKARPFGHTELGRQPQPERPPGFDPLRYMNQCGDAERPSAVRWKRLPGYYEGRIKELGGADPAQVFYWDGNRWYSKESPRYRAMDPRIELVVGPERVKGEGVTPILLKAGEGWPGS